MKNDLKQKWIKALKSGDYEQGKEKLCKIVGDRKEYCCLGVLAEITGNLLNTSEKKDGYFCFGVKNPIEDSPNYLGEFPTSLLNDLELDAFTQNRLIQLNDSCEKSFIEIANWIEKNI